MEEIQKLLEELHAKIKHVFGETIQFANKLANKTYEKHEIT